MLSKYSQWLHSSYSDYIGRPREWIHPEDLLGLFDSKEQYIEFINDYEAMQRERDEIKQSLYGA